MHRRAFTIFELLAVITVITVLLALLLPALSFARERARVMVCSSNLKQIHLLLLNYAIEHKTNFPRVFIPASVRYVAMTRYSDTPIERYDLRLALDPYIDSPNIFYCPSGGSIVAECGEFVEVATPESDFGWSWNEPDHPCYPHDSTFISYGIWPVDDRYFFPDIDLVAPQIDVPKVNAATNPGQIIMAMDLALTDFGFDVPGFMNHPNAMSEYYGPDTGTGWNKIFHDGHVTWTDIDDREVMATYQGVMIWFR